MPKKINWTDEMKGELSRLHQILTPQELADRFNLHLVTMYATLRRFGLAKSRKVRNDRSEQGSIRTRKDGSQFIMTPDGWRPLSIHLWEQANGPIPKGHKVCIVDKTRQVTLENLELKTMREIAALSVQIRPKKGDPNSKTAIRIREQEERRLKRIADKAARAEAKAKEAEAKKAEGYKLTPARLAHLEKIRQIKNDRLALTKEDRQRKKEQERREREAKKRQAAVEKEWQKRPKRIESQYKTKQVDDTVPKVFIPKLRAWIYLRPGQSAEEVIQKYSPKQVAA